MLEIKRAESREAAWLLYLRPYFNSAKKAS